jgi:exonuclease III
MNSERALEKLKFDGYRTFHRQREDGKNGAAGVAILVQLDVVCEINNEFDHLNLEVVAINIKHAKQGILTFASYYNPSNCLLSKELFDKLSKKNKLIICGDFNAKSRCFGSENPNRNGQVLEEILMVNSKLVVNSKCKTYIGFKDKKPNILDLCVCTSEISNNLNFFQVLKHEDMNSDHIPFLVEFDLVSETNHKRCMRRRMI